ncbi:MAG TPA: DUF945 family protein [Gammaproteobacteria bacterium]|nr:DUF945 family protein [Gammaproteobacteria bacterium]
MKKLAVAILAIVAVALLALPEVFGRLTEAQVKARVAVINNAAWSAEVTSYERGWFRSHAVIDLGLNPAYAAALAGPNVPRDALGGHLPVAIDVAHGPIAALDGVYFGWSKIVARSDRASPRIAALEQQLGIPHLFEFRSRTSFLGETSFEAEVPMFGLPIETASGSVNFSGLSAAGTIRGNHVKSDGRVDSIELSMPDGEVALRGLRATIDAEIRSSALVLGTSGMEIDSVSATSLPAVFDAEKLKFAWKSTLDASGGRLDMNMSYDMASLTVADVKLTDASIGFAFRNVDVDAFAAYRDAAREYARSRDPTSMLSAATRLIAAGLTVVVEPVRVLADGELFEARLELTPNERAAAGAASFAEWAGALDGGAQIDISRRLAERIAQQALRMQLANDPSIPAEQLDATVQAQSGAVLLMLAGQGILEANGTGYRAKVDLANGQLLLNGRPMPLP